MGMKTNETNETKPAEGSANQQTKARIVFSQIF